jgi:hypothetical protein
MNASCPESDSRVVNVLVEQLRVLTRPLPLQERRRLTSALLQFLFRQVFHNSPESKQTIAVARFRKGDLAPLEITWLVKLIRSGKLSLAPDAAVAEELVLQVNPSVPPDETFAIDADSEIFEQFLSNPDVPKLVNEEFQARSGRPNPTLARDGPTRDREQNISLKVNGSTHGKA